jgi:hypothetical protein
MRTTESPARRKFGAMPLVLAALHLLALACYTFPEHFVPAGARHLAMLYARPLFHQQWLLFAPDPPLCHREIQISADGELWHTLHREGAHYLERRMVRNIVHHVHEGLQRGAIPVPLRETIHRACQPFGDPETLQYRLMEWCITNAGEPLDRELRVTPFTP